MPGVVAPKVGGALRGIGETFRTNPATGTASLAIPVPLTPGRFQPSLTLTYDSGGGNGPFGLGWADDLSAITRRTDKRLPTGLDHVDDDTFNLSGAEDLVPQSPAGLAAPELVEAGVAYRVYRYRPRVEQAFAQIERWQEVATGTSHWRIRGPDNALSIYGRSALARLADPEDPGRVHGWLLEAAYDAFSNAAHVVYKPEDEIGLTPAIADPARGRPVAWLYPKRLRYGYRSRVEPGADLGARTDFMFELVFDYGEHPGETPGPAETDPWPVRADGFSSFRAGFEMRCRRLCRRLLMFHHFPEADAVGADCLVRSLALRYAAADDSGSHPDLGHPAGALLREVVERGHKRTPGRHTSRAMPTLTLDYTLGPLRNPSQVLSVAPKTAAPETLENLPAGVSAEFRLIDVEGTGVPGILFDAGGALYYKRNLSPLDPLAQARFGALEALAERPAAAMPGAGALVTDGDGQNEFVNLSGPARGYYHRGPDGRLEAFRAFAQLPPRHTEGAAAVFIDLDGDGRADILTGGDDDFLWFPLVGSDGFGAARRARVEAGPGAPSFVLAEKGIAVFTADMTGDGLADTVHVSAAGVSYSPNLGHGRFGRARRMAGSPVAPDPTVFDPKRVRVVDLDGTGPSDVLYLGAAGPLVFRNLSGNALADPVRLEGFPLPHSGTEVDCVDLLGIGTACLVWSSTLPADSAAALRYVDLFDGEKPNLLRRIDPNTGAETRLFYTASTHFTVADREAGLPVLTRTPFPVQTLTEVRVRDRLSDSLFVTRYSYRYPVYDPVEREFHCFAFAEQWDTATLAMIGGPIGAAPPANWNAASHVAPVRTRSWVHTGLAEAPLLARFLSAEFWQDPRRGAGETLVPALPPGLSPAEEHEALRALRGRPLRVEVTAPDGTLAGEVPFTVTEYTHAVRRVAPETAGRPATFLPHPRETRTFHFERDLGEPRIAHEVVLAVDDFGNVERAVSIGYGRRQPEPTLSAADRALQARDHVRLVLTQHTAPIAVGGWRTPLPYRAEEFAAFALPAPQGRCYRFDEIDAHVATLLAPGIAEIDGCDGDAAEAAAAGAVPTRQRRALTLTCYRGDDLVDRPFGRASLLGLTAESFDLTMTAALIDATLVTPGRMSAAAAAAALVEGGYLASADLAAQLGLAALPAGWWMRSGRTFLAPDPTLGAAAEFAFARAHFFQPHAAVDAFGAKGTLTFDDPCLVPVDAVDPVGNRTSAGSRNAVGALTPRIDYRTLQPTLVTDPNGVETAFATDALVLVAATALMGRSAAPTGDSLAGLGEYDDLAVAAHIAAFAAGPDAEAALRLGNATTLIMSDLLAFQRTRGQPAPQPLTAIAHARERHVGDGAGGVRSSIAYSDGFGRQLQAKARADDGPLVEGGPDIAPRWIGSGWQIYDNKGRVVRRFEPFFSATPAFETGLAVGVSGVMLYDPGDQVSVALAADHSWTKTRRSAWGSVAEDANSLSLVADPSADADVGWLIARLPAALYLPTWGAPRRTGALGLPERRAAEKAALLADTPTRVFVDALGRTLLTRKDLGDGTFAETRSFYDADGAVREVIDALGRIAERYRRDLLGRPFLAETIDGGARATVPAIDGQPIRTFDDRGHASRLLYDAARRPVASLVRDADPARPGAEVEVGRLRYGDEAGVPGAAAAHLRGRLWKRFDGAGGATIEAYDVHGHETRSTRQFMADPAAIPDWSQLAAADGESLTSLAEHDAVDRVRSATAPDNSVLRYSYGRGGLLTEVRFTPPRGAETVLVRRVARNARGQRVLTEHGNGAVTTVGYDPLSFRVREIRSERLQAPRLVQLLRYAYDANGNATSVGGSPDERAIFQQTAYFMNANILVGSEYLYDALGRLIEARGREHEGQAQPSWADAFDGARTLLAHPHDARRMRNYVQSYTYDLAGNLKKISHAAGAAGSWTRKFRYQAPSRIAPPAGPPPMGNRLTESEVGGQSSAFNYDAHGNMDAVGEATALVWSHADELLAANVGTGSVLFRYGGGSERMRKVWRKGPNRSEERLYVGNYEIWRHRDGTGQVRRARVTLHVSDGTDRLALVERRAGGLDPDPAPPLLLRYQYVDRLSSAMLELDATGDVLSYEEYHPYGSTAFQAVAPALETPKRYRFTGRERDEETGLYHHGQRYYAPWLGRWISADPAGAADGSNLYAYCRGDPVGLHDPGGTNGLPKPEPILVKGGPKAPIIGDFPGWGSRWKQAAEKVLQRKFGTTTLQEGLQAFEKHIETTLETVGRGSNKKPGAVFEARKTFKAVRAEFKVLMEAAGVSMEGVQVHHGLLKKLAEHPKKALDATALIVAKGQAAVKGTTHNLAHTIEEALPASTKAILAKTEEAASKLVGKVKSGAEAVKSGVAGASQYIPKGKAGKAGFVELGLLKGIAGVGLSVVGGAFSYQSLKEELKTGDYGGAVSSGAGVAESGVSLVAMGARALGVAGAGTSVTALYGTSVGALGAGEAIAAAPHVVGAFAVGALIGTGLEKGLKISEVASEHGLKVEAATRAVLRATGLGGEGEGAMYVGAVGAAISSITVAPTIAAQRRLDELGSYLARKLF